MEISRCEPVFSGLVVVPAGRASCPATPRRDAMVSTICVGLLPRGLLGGAEDRAEGDLDPRRRRCARRPRRRGLIALDLLGRVGQRLAPQAVDVGLGRADRVGRARRTAEGDLRARLLHREHVADEVGEAVVLAVVVERLVARPRLLEDLDVLEGAGVALVLGQEVALALLLVVVAAGDEVQRQPAVADLVERGERLGRERRDRQVRAVGQQQLQPFGVAGDVRRRLRRVRAARPVGGEHAVPAVLLVGAGEAQRVVACRSCAPLRGWVSDPSLVAPIPRNSTGMLSPPDSDPQIMIKSVNFTLLDEHRSELSPCPNRHVSCDGTGGSRSRSNHAWRRTRWRRW